VNDQKILWNKKHAAGEHAAMRDAPHEFAQELAPHITPGTKILELGCGVGSDARFFASLGVNVVSTDFSEVVIEQNMSAYGADNLSFEVMDITKPFQHTDKSFDIVYAHLSLHYYDYKVTKAVFREIARVLKGGGMLYFSCKSIHDPKYGEGKEIGPGVFERNGHIRHFFSLDYTQQLLDKDYEVVKLEEAEGVYSDGKSAFIHCWAKKREA
jgi:SAM-dependent methyltransferase